jgi:hypothetical protein
LLQLQLQLVVDDVLDGSAGATNGTHGMMWRQNLLLLSGPSVALSGGLAPETAGSAKPGTTKILTDNDTSIHTRHRHRHQTS